MGLILLPLKKNLSFFSEKRRQAQRRTTPDAGERAPAKRAPGSRWAAAAGARRRNYIRSSLPGSLSGFDGVSPPLLRRRTQRCKAADPVHEDHLLSGRLASKDIVQQGSCNHSRFPRAVRASCPRRDHSTQRPRGIEHTPATKPAKAHP